MDAHQEENAAIEIHDSTLLRIEFSGDELVAVVDVYLHRSYGRPGFDPGTGWEQQADLRFRNGRIVGSIEGLPLELLGGRLSVLGTTQENIIPLPLDVAEPSRLQLESWNGRTVVIEGDGVAATLVGAPRYLEQFEP